MSWEALTAISTTVYTFTVIVAGVFAILQWREVGGARQLESTVALLDRLQGKTLSATRDHFRRHPEQLSEILNSGAFSGALDRYLREQGPEHGISSSLAEFRRSLRELEFVAILCLNRAIPKKLERAYLAPTMMSYWIAFAPYVEAVRLARGDDVYLQHVSALIGMVEDGSLFTRRSACVKRAALGHLMSQGETGALRRSKEVFRFSADRHIDTSPEDAVDENPAR